MKMEDKIMIFNFFIKNRKLKMARDEVRKLDGKYFAVVCDGWKELKWSRETTICKESTFQGKTPGKVSVLKGIDLVMANKEPVKKIFLSRLPENVQATIENYVKYLKKNNVEIFRVEDL